VSTPQLTQNKSLTAILELKGISDDRSDENLTEPGHVPPVSDPTPNDQINQSNTQDMHGNDDPKETTAIGDTTASAETGPGEGALGDVESGAETSEGEDVRLRTEFFRDRFDDLKQRTKMTPKRAKQMYQFATIMEERVGFLEDTCKEIGKRLKMKLYEETDSETQGPANKRELVFKLRHLLWSEFQGIKEEKASLHVIDVLVDEADYQNRNSFDPRRRSFRSGHEHAKDIDVRSQDRQQGSPIALEKAVENVRGHRLPGQIRINSGALIHILRKHFHSDAVKDRAMSSPPYHVLRPFKAISHYEDEIRALRDDLMKIIESTLLARTTRPNSEQTHNVSPVIQPKIVQEPPPADDSGCAKTIGKEDWGLILKDLGLFHSDEALRTILQEWDTDEAVKKTFDCLFEFIDEYVKPVTTRLRQRDASKVRFAELWHLFRPGDEIVVRHKTVMRQTIGERTMIMRVMRTNGGRHHIHPSVAPSFDSTPLPPDRPQPVNGINPFSIHAWYIDYNGISLTPIRRRIVIQPYSGERSITDLETFPISYYKDVDQLKSALIERGKRFVKYATSPSACYCDCRGETLDTQDEVNEKVIVDMKEYGKGGNLPKYSEPDALDFSETSTCDRGLDCTLGSECYHGTLTIIDDQHTDKTMLKDYISEQSIFQQVSGNDRHGGIKLTDNEYVICNYRLHAYKLRSREWVKVHVNSLEEAKATDNKKGFDRLVLPQAHKHIIRSQVEEHFRKKALRGSSTSDELDLVRGKGQGLIILLHGAPGVGKTCTAETIADLVHKPLYPITCGDLGSTAKAVEATLKEHFTLASRWDCVMLLDEADVFLAKRRSEDLHRNSIVSVFLRIMEYYKGLLFLTTNRVGIFDEAFKSRVHISLWYAEFDQDTTVKVWKTFIRQTKESVKNRGWKHFKVNSGDILEFAEEYWQDNPTARWNGRQIRNAFHTAIAMAEFDARKKEEGEEPTKIILGREQFEKIASTVRDFDKYLIETVGTTFEERAAKEGLRKYKAHEPKKRAQDERVRKTSKKSKKKRYSSSEDDSKMSSTESEQDKKDKRTVKSCKQENYMSSSDSIVSDLE
jgi:hypothetical protein